MTTAVAIPCRNEADSIGDLIRLARRHVDLVYVANDGSTDDTADVARAAGARVVDVPRDRAGLSAVYRAGLNAALVDGHNIILEMDAGGSHSPSSLPIFIQSLFGLDVDVAFGRRFGPKANYDGPFKRWALSRGGTILFNLRHGTEWFDATSGFIAYRRHALEQLLAKPWCAGGHFYQSEVRARSKELGLRLSEVPIRYVSSSSSLRPSSIVEALWMLR